MSGSYVFLDTGIYYGIHPGIVFPDRTFDHYVILTTPDQTADITLTPQWCIYTDSPSPSIIEHPINDRKAPSTLDEYIQLITVLSKLDGDVYIACKGGHGRSGLVAAGLYAMRHKTSYETTVKYVTSQWRNQRDMTRLRPIIRKLGSPQSASQKRMLYNYIQEFVLKV